MMQTSPAPTRMPTLSWLLSHPPYLSSKSNCLSIHHRYTAYSIRTKTSRPDYGPAETIVLRRFSDFVWLREQLTYEYVGAPSPGPVHPTPPTGRMVPTPPTSRASRCLTLAAFPVLALLTDPRPEPFLYYRS